MRIAIANDTSLACEALRRVVLSDPTHRLAWIARDGAEALRLARQDPPDLLLMDLVMPVMDGVEATRRIMAEAPCLILLVTSSVGHHMPRVFEAMGHGALDAVNTPALGPRGDLEGGPALLEKIDTLGKLLPGATPAQRAPAAGGCQFPVVLLGASTGGPNALAEVLSGVPADWEGCGLIVQHVDEAFAPALARWLGERSGRVVALAEEGEPPTPGRWLLARTNDHLAITAERRLGYTPEPRSMSFRPSVDVLFSSMAEHWPHPGAAALLTGMDRDGARGLLRLRLRGWHTIAQDEATSVVWGMPRAAVELGAATQVLPLSEIASALCAQASGRR